MSRPHRITTTLAAGALGCAALGLALTACTRSGHEAPPADGARSPAAQRAGGPATRDETAAEPDPGSGPVEPYVLVVGTGQDGGLPHASCSCAHCAAARDDPRRARAVASLAIVPPPPAKPWLVDATPDLRVQLERLPRFGDDAPGRVDRDPLDGVLLTHAHLGHYTGLGFLGFEAMNVDGLVVRATPSLSSYLAANAPWSQLVERGNVRLESVAPDTAVELPGGVRAMPFAVPHRDELSDTVGYRIEGPERTVLYVPDTDGWARWDPPLESRLDGVDVALLDGTFYSPDELPGRPVSSIGHPLIRDTMDRLQPLVDAGGIEILFTHLNHSNPALEPDGPERAEIVRRGFGVVEEGARIGLAGEHATGGVSAR